MKKERSIAIVGLGYVGLPLSIELAKHLVVIGFDINELRIKDLLKGIDSTNEVSTKEIKKSNITYRKIGRRKS